MSAERMAGSVLQVECTAISAGALRGRRWVQLLRRRSHRLALREAAWNGLSCSPLPMTCCTCSTQGIFRARRPPALAPAEYPFNPCRLAPFSRNDGQQHGVRGPLPLPLTTPAAVGCGLTSAAEPSTSVSPSLVGPNLHTGISPSAPHAIPSLQIFDTSTANHDSAFPHLTSREHRRKIDERAGT